MRKKKAKMGRPPLPPSERQARIVSVRVTEAELKMLRAEAKRRGVTVSALLLGPWRKG